MKKVLLIILITLTTAVSAQTDTTWKQVLIEPDISVYFPDTPKLKENPLVTTYEYQNSEVVLRVTSEKNPINYNGRTIEEVDSEYYSTLTSKTITGKQRLLKEKDTKFRGHDLRELIYSDTINSKPCTVTLQILNVTGFEEAMYKFYFIDFKNRMTIPENYAAFFSNWELYYKLENDIDNNKSRTNKILRKNGFKVVK